MTDEEIDRAAAALYAHCAAERGPAWGMLTDVTRSVWWGYVLAGVELPLW
jgi:hypothetical protein